MTERIGRIVSTNPREGGDVTTTVSDTEKLRELDEWTRRAWIAYNERLRDLAGDEYEQAESDSWSELQQELDRLQRRRASLTQNSTA
jgi:cell division septum initiation protein DivIVA